VTLIWPLRVEPRLAAHSSPQSSVGISAVFRYSHAGSKNSFFITGGGWQGFSHLVYPWPAWRQPWNKRLPAFVSSLRIEALRESIDDYEYMQILTDTAGRQPAGSPFHQRCLNLLEEAKTFAAKSNLGDDYRYGGSHSVFQFDGNELNNLMRKIGRALTEASRQQVAQRPTTDQ